MTYRLVVMDTDWQEETRHVVARGLEAQEAVLMKERYEKQLEAAKGWTARIEEEEEAVEEKKKTKKMTTEQAVEAISELRDAEAIRQVLMNCTKKVILEVYEEFMRTGVNVNSIKKSGLNKASLAYRVADNIVRRIREKQEKEETTPTAEIIGKVEEAESEEEVKSILSGCSAKDMLAVYEEIREMPFYRDEDEVDIETLTREVAEGIWDEISWHRRKQREFEAEEAALTATMTFEQAVEKIRQLRTEGAIKGVLVNCTREVIIKVFDELVHHETYIRHLLTSWSRVILKSETAQAIVHEFALSAESREAS